MDRFLTILCCLCLLLTVIACLSVHNVYNVYRPDMYAVIISILTLLVTVLLGWQIYNTIGINKKVAGINKIAEKAAQRENEIYNHTTLAVVYYINAVDFYKRQNIVEETVDGMFRCMEEGLKGRFEFPINMAVDYLLEIPANNFIIYGRNKDYYMRILYSIHNDTAKLLIPKIQNAYEN